MEHTTLPVTRIALAVAVILAVLFLPQWLRSRGRGLDQAAHASAVLRENILTRQFIAQFPPGKPGAPRCVLMDWNVGGSVATLVAFDDGTVSLYLSSGGGIIGAGAHANVARAAGPFREQARAILSKLSPSTTFPLPAGNNNVVFYVVTDSTTLSSGEIDVGLSGLPASHPFAGLLNSAQALITEVRRAS